MLAFLQAGLNMKRKIITKENNMKKPLFAEMHVEVTKYLRLRFKLTFSKEELWVLIVIDDKNTGLDRPYGFNDIQYHRTLEDCMSYKNCVLVPDNKRKRMDTKVHLTVKEFLAGLSSFEAVEVFVSNFIKHDPNI